MRLEPVIWYTRFQFTIRLHVVCMYEYLREKVCSYTKPCDNRSSFWNSRMNTYEKRSVTVQSAVTIKIKGFDFPLEFGFFATFKLQKFTVLNSKVHWFYSLLYFVVTIVPKRFYWYFVVTIVQKVYFNCLLWPLSKKFISTFVVTIVQKDYFNILLWLLSKKVILRK